MNAIQRVALLGGGGFIGSWLTERLTETGKETVILTRRPDHAASARIFPTAEIVGVDACDTDALSQALAGCDAVVNLVGILHGNVTILAGASYFIPVLSSALSVWLLGASLSWAFWQGAAMVCAGAILCWLATRR